MKEVFEYQKEYDKITRVDFPALDLKIVDATFEYEQYSRQKKNVLAAAVTELMDKWPKGTSMTRLETMARTSTLYKEHIATLCETKRNVVRAKYAKDTLMSRCEYLRTCISLEKTKMGVL